MAIDWLRYTGRMETGDDKTVSLIKMFSAPADYIRLYLDYSQPHHGLFQHKGKRGDGIYA